MATLMSDTVYYRYDHPNGFLFAAGMDAPGADWTTDQNAIPAGPSVTYECTTLAAFQALLTSERQGAAITVNNLRSDLNNTINGAGLLAQQLEAARAEIAVLTSQVSDLTAQLGGSGN